MSLYAHISRATIPADRHEEVRRFWLDEVAPSARRQPGFVASIDAIDAQDPTLHHRIGVWRRPEDLEAFTVLPEHDVLNEHFAELGHEHLSRVDARAYAVTLADVRAQAGAVRVTVSPVKPGLVDELVDRWETELRPIFERQEGLLDLQAFIDDEDNFILELYFDDEQNLERFATGPDHEERLIPVFDRYLEPVTRRAALRVI